MLQYAVIINNQENKILNETKFGLFGVLAGDIQIYLKFIMIPGGHLILQGSSKQESKELVQRFVK